MRVVFMGTPDYSVVTLRKLCEAGHKIEAVFAQPDKPVGRKQILTPPPVANFAKENEIPLYQPSTLKDGEAKIILENINPDIIVVVAYGKILPSDILSIPKYGCVNGHASLLPELRGASPIQWAIVSGKKTTGITTMLMDEGMDTGDILLQSETPIGEEETAEELFERLSYISADLMCETLEKLESGKIVPKKQDSDKANYAPIIKKEMAKLDFSLDAETLFCAVKGYYSWPCAFFFLDGKRVKVIKAKIGSKVTAECGTVVKSDNSLVIACNNGSSLELLRVQPEGKQAMDVCDMLRGKSIKVGTKVN